MNIIGRNKTLATERMGETKVNRYGTPMKIIKYNSSSDVIVEFQDEHKFKTKTTYSNFNRETIINPYDKSVCDIGYIGEGKYSYQSNGEVNTVYDIWKNMLRRCYSDKLRWKYPAYEDCEMCDEWLNLQNFCEWYFENYYDVGDGGRMHIDKDILFKGNRIYSPEKCIFVPQRINMVFTKKNRNTDADLPTGIHRAVNGYSAMYNTKSLGVHKSLDKAIEIYNIEKRIHIKQVVEEYGDRLPFRISSILLNW